jgi:hypothetical protein
MQSVCTPLGSVCSSSCPCRVGVSVRNEIYRSKPSSRESRYLEQAQVVFASLDLSSRLLVGDESLTTAGTHLDHAGI